MIYTALLNIGIFQGIVLGLVILKSALFNSRSNKYVAFLLFTFSIILLNHVLEIQYAFTDYPVLQFLNDIEWVFLLPVFLFLFIRNRINEGVPNEQKTFLYFIPFAYSAVLNIGYDLHRVAGLFKIPEAGLYVTSLLGLAQLFLALTFIPFMLIRSYFLIRHLKDARERRWIMTFLTIVALLLFAFLTIYIVGLSFHLDISATMGTLALTATVVTHWTAYVGIYKYRLAKNKEAVYHFLNNDVGPPAKGLQLTEKPATQEAVAAEELRETITADNPYFQKLELLCREQHIYTDSTLNREKVAEKLGISPGYVSQIINSVTGDNFAHYMNRYRVEAVKEMISNAEYENYNLLAMGLESGFTSKTTFYKAFKKVTGQTPNEYKNTDK